MRPGPEIRAHVATGRLWRLFDDRARLLGVSDGGGCRHVCSDPISRGHALGVARATAAVPVHLECYMFWLHASGLLEHEPITCAACRRLIPPHAERTVVRDAAYHVRCRDRIDDPEPSLGLLAPREPARSNR
jgi:hypothetical protein